MYQLLPKPRKKRPFWEFDPTAFQPGPKARILERVLTPFRSLGKYLLFALALTYPLYIVILGVAFGGLVFWTAFGGSVALMGIIITKAGYARNFQNWDISMKKMGALVVAFLATLGLYLGIIHLRILVVPVFAAILVLGLLIFVLRGKI
jgi:hypothetical protein